MVEGYRASWGLLAAPMAMAMACLPPAHDVAVAARPSGGGAGLSGEPVPFTAEEVALVLGGASAREDWRDEGGALPPERARLIGGTAPGSRIVDTRTRALMLPVWPTRLFPEKSLYFVPPDFLRITQLNGRGEFVASRHEGGGIWHPVLGRWDGDLEVTRLTSTGEGMNVGDFKATGIDDNGIVVGSVVVEAPQPGTSGLIHLATAWLDASMANPIVHSQLAPGARSSEWLAVSRSAGFAAGQASSFTAGACQGIGTAEAWPLLGRYDLPAMGPIADATSIPCFGCSDQLAVTYPMSSSLVAVNDSGEAVGTAEVRDPDWSCRLGVSGWPGAFFFETRGVQVRPIYVSPGGVTFDLEHLLSPPLTGPRAVGINDSRTIAGTAYLGNSPIAFRHDLRTGATATLPWSPAQLRRGAGHAS